MNYVELNTFVKLCGLASTGGQAKTLIRSGNILVNGISETRNRRKLIAGDKISYSKKIFIVRKEMCLMTKDE